MVELFACSVLLTKGLEKEIPKEDNLTKILSEPPSQKGIEQLHRYTRLSIKELNLGKLFNI